MDIFVFEYVTGGGLLGQDAPAASLLAEGRAMLRALVADFCRLPQVKVTATCDRRFLLDFACEITEVATAEQRDAAFAKLVGNADWTLVIAPEFDGLLHEYARRAVAAGGRMLGPAPEFIAIAADKQRTAEVLTAANVPVPAGIRLEQGRQLPERFRYPAVLKRLDGAGSLDVLLLPDEETAMAYGPVKRNARLERFVRGTAASVAVLCGPHAIHTLPACHQKLSDDGRFAYLGGASPLDDDLSGRAEQLAVDAVKCLPGALGYVGVDMVLGEVAADDVVIEINPRLTTSYVGLRAACPENLAGAMLDLASGQQVELAAEKKRVDFDADGTVRCLPTKCDRAY